MRIFIYPEKKEFGVGRLNSPDTDVAMFAVGTYSEFSELWAALDICKVIGYNQTKYIHNLYQGVFFADTAEFFEDDKNPMIVMYVDKAHLFSLLDKDVDDPVATLHEDIGRIHKVRREIISVVGTGDLSEDLTDPKTRLDFLTVLPSCLNAILNNRIPQRRKFIAVHDAMEADEVLGIIDSLSNLFKTLIEVNAKVINKVE
jgi:hypothetical protein